jgi:hypothetical protein
MKRARVDVSADIATAVRMFLEAGDLSLLRSTFGRPLFVSLAEARSLWPQCVDEFFR